jgi:hypothetical protein
MWLSDPSNFTTAQSYLDLDHPAVVTPSGSILSKMAYFWNMAPERVPDPRGRAGPQAQDVRARRHRTHPTTHS